MNLTQILALVIQAMTTRSTAFAVTVGQKHLSVTIVQGTTPGHTSWSDLFVIIGMILSGVPGTFQVGVFTVTVALLQPTPTIASSGLLQQQATPPAAGTAAPK